MLKQVLNKFLILNDVQAAIVMEETGEIIQSMKSGIVIEEDLRTVMATILQDLKTNAVRLGYPSFSMVFVEFADQILILGPVINTFYLVIIAKNTANIGQITYEMKKHQDAIVSLL